MVIMINDFLVRLSRLAVPPTNPSSPAGDIYWPEYTPSVLSEEEQKAHDVLFLGADTPLMRLLRAIQLVWVVLDSPLGHMIASRDNRLTYDTYQLQAQFVGSGYDEASIEHVLHLLSEAPPPFLNGFLASTYRSSFTRLDKLAALATYFGAEHE